ncbi:MAG: ABC transporter permease [Thermosphaera sp.]
MSLRPLVIREVKAFVKNPAFIFSLILIFIFYGVLGQLISAGVQTAVQETVKVQVGLVQLDESEFAKKVVEIANHTMGGRLQLVPSVEYGLSRYDLVVVLPSDFTVRALSLNESLHIETYVKVDTVSPVVSGAKTNLAYQVSDFISKSATYVIALERNIDPSLINKAVSVNSTVQVYGKTMRMEEYSAFSTITGFLPLVIAVIIGVNSMYASQFTAVEKVEKAFEMLLAQPIPRRNVVFAKIIGSIIASLLMGLAYFAGILLLLSGSLSTPQGVDQGAVNLAEFVYTKIGVDPLIISIASIVLGLIYSGAIGVTLGSIVSDERIAGAITTPIMFVFIGVGYALIFIGLPVNLTTGIIAGITIAPLPVVAIVSSMLGDYTTLTVSLISAVISTIIVMSLAIYIFNRDIVVLGLRIGKLRMKEKS